MTSTCAPSGLSKVLRQSDLWMKQSSEGRNGLLRAVSVCIYFTERYQEVLKSLLHSFFIHHFYPRLKTEKQKKTAENFLQNMFLFEFESLILDITSRIFNIEVILFFMIEGSLKTQHFNRGGRSTIRILRVSEVNYAALFPLNQKPDYKLAQNLVLSLVESVLDKCTFQLKNLNGGKLLNYDFKRWLSQSKPLMHPFETPPMIDCNKHFLSQSSHEKVKSEGKVKLNKNLRVNVGSELVNLFKKRKTSNISSSHAQQMGFSNIKIPKHLLAFRTYQSDIVANKSPINIEGNTLQNETQGSFEEVFGLEHRSLSAQCLWPSLSFDQDRPDHFDTTMSLLDNGQTKLNSSSDDLLLFKLEKEVSAPSTLVPPSVGKEGVACKTPARVDQVETPSKSKPKETFKEKLLKKQKLAKPFLGNDTVNLATIKSFPLSDGQQIKDKTQTEVTSKLLEELRPQNPKERYTETVDKTIYNGVLKFFDEKNAFGFFQIMREKELEDVFVYKSEFDKANIKTENLKTLKTFYTQPFSFQIATYKVGNESKKKAINIKML